MTVEERETLPVKEKLEALYNSVQSKIGDHRNNDDLVLDELDEIFPEPDEQVFADDDTEEEMADANQRSEADAYTPETFDKYINAQVKLPRGGASEKATIIRRGRDADGIPMGTANSNPILDTREYVARFDDGAEQAYAANLIAENLYSQIDREGHHFAVMQEIIDHEVGDTALSKDDSMYKDKHGRMQPKRTTKAGNSSWNGRTGLQRGRDLLTSRSQTQSRSQNTR